MPEKIYCGSAKARETQYGEQLTVSVNLSALLENFVDFGYVSKAGNKTMTLKISKRKEIGKYNETHIVEIDQWKPETGRTATQGQAGNNSQQTGVRPSQNEPVYGNLVDSMGNELDRVPF